MFSNKNSSLHIDFKRKVQIVKSKSPSKFRKLPEYTPILRSPEKASFRYQKSENIKQKDEEMVNLPLPANLEKKNSKNRKCSADVTTLTEWLKASSKKIETPFGNSTFSTNTTFKYSQEYEDKKESKNESTEKQSHENP